MGTPRQPPDVVTTWFFRLAYPVVLAVGVFLRIQQLPSQVLMDDEWHALSVAVQNGYGYILTHFGIADFSIPMCLLDRLCLDTVGLTELLARAPAILCGVGALFVMPLLLRGLFPRSLVFGFTCLLAISPLHIFFTRCARPYAITNLLSLVAVMGLYRWYVQGRLHYGLLWVLAGAAAIYCHLLVVPMIAAPFVYVIFGLVRHRFAGKQGPVLLMLALALGALLGLALLPPVLRDLGALKSKLLVSKGGRIDWFGGFSLLCGSGSSLVFGAYLAFVIVGAALIASANRGVFFLFGLIVTLHAMMLFVSRPNRFENGQDLLDQVLTELKEPNSLLLQEMAQHKSAFDIY